MEAGGSGVEGVWSGRRVGGGRRWLIGPVQRLLLAGHFATLLPFQVPDLRSGDGVVLEFHDGLADGMESLES